MKFNEKYFYSTISYAKEFSLKNLINEQKKILEELNEKKEFLINYDKNIDYINNNYAKSQKKFNDIAIYFKNNIEIKKFFEPGIFKSKEKVDIIISNETLNKLETLFRDALNELYYSYDENKKLITKGLYPKITFKHYKLKPTGDYYNVRKILDVEEEEKVIPKYVLKDVLTAMGTAGLKNMFNIIPPGLDFFNVSRIRDSKSFLFYKSMEYTPDQEIVFEKFYTERARKNLLKLANIFDPAKLRDEYEYNGPFCYMAIPKKSFYLEMFKEEEQIRNKQIRQIELYIRAKTKRQKKEDDVGFVYVLKSVGYPGLYKIGSTYGLAEERAEELSGTNVPDPWTVASKIKIKDALYFEKLIHKLLTKYRYRKGREFFKIDIKVIKNCLKDVLEISNKGTKKVTSNNFKKFNY